MKLTLMHSFIILGLVLFSPKVSSAKKTEVFELLDLNKAGLEVVKSAVNNEDYERAADALLKYYRQRTSVKHPAVNKEDKASYAGKKLSSTTLEMANGGMKHEFFVHKGYGYFDYGKEIDWQYWPVKDNEVRWQLHRMYWWIPMGEMYWVTHDEKYAQEWVWQLRDWIKDNPIGLSKENDRFAWRPLEVARRLQDFTNLFTYFVESGHFTSDFLLEFLSNYHLHAQVVRKNYSEQGNHLLFEAQRMVYAGGFFPEFKDAPQWRKEGIDILISEIEKQVYDDGLQYELSLNYHVASINIFLKALRMAQLCKMENEFPQAYKDKVESMIMAIAEVSYPDFIYPMFSDAKKGSKRNMLKNYKLWAKVFPDNALIAYYATSGKSGKLPEYKSKALKNSGFYVFRNAWKEDATVMVLKASPPAFWHSQPDNGTFELWVKGRNFMPDAGCYVYAGDEEIMKMRNWYRQSCVHQTMTLDNHNIKVDGKLVEWKTSDDLDKLVYENPSYASLKHRRTVFFIDQKYFVFIDEAIGDAAGTVDVHFQLVEGAVKMDKKQKWVKTTFEDGNNLFIKNFTQGAKMIEEEGKVSYSYKKEIERPALAFQQKKKANENLRFYTVIVPFEGKKQPKITLKDTGERNITVSLDGKSTNLNF